MRNPLTAWSNRFPFVYQPASLLSVVRSYWLYGPPLINPDLIYQCNPALIRHKVRNDSFQKRHAPGTILCGDWDCHTVDVTQTTKFASIHQRFIEGRDWIETDLFAFFLRRAEEGRPYFRNRFLIKSTDDVRELALKYEREMDHLYFQIRQEGFSKTAPPILVHISRNGTPLMGDEGNHRLAMAQALAVEKIYYKVVITHSQWHCNTLS